MSLLGAPVSTKTLTRLLPPPRDSAYGGIAAERDADDKEIALPPSALSQYVGTDAMRTGFDLSITLETDHLMAQLTGQPKFPIFAEAENRFFFKIVEATLEFQRDASGALTAVRLRQGPIDQIGPEKSRRRDRSAGNWSMIRSTVDAAVVVWSGACVVIEALQKGFVRIARADR